MLSSDRVYRSEKTNRDMYFRLATNSDDPAIRQLLRQIPLDGMLKIRYQREPSYVSSMQKQGILQQTLVGESSQGEVLAVVSRNIQRLHINGKQYYASYICNVRMHPNARHGVSLLKGIKALEQLPTPYPVDFHYATLIEKDPLTKKVFASGRPSMPSLFDLGKIITYSIPLKKNKQKAPKERKINVLPCTQELFPHVLTFLQEESIKTPFFPDMNEENYHQELLSPENFFIAFEKDQVVGVCNVNNLQNNKQFVIENYSWKFSLLKWPINFLLGIRGLYPVPERNEQIKLLTLGFPVTLNNRMDILEALITHIYARFSGTGNHYLSLALHENNPLKFAVSHFPKIKYESRLYFVKLKGDNIPDIEDNRVAPFIDLPRL